MVEKRLRCSAVAPLALHSYKIYISSYDD